MCGVRVRQAALPEQIHRLHHLKTTTHPQEEHKWLIKDLKQKSQHAPCSSIFCCLFNSGYQSSPNVILLLEDPELFSGLMGCIIPQHVLGFFQSDMYTSKYVSSEPFMYALVRKSISMTSLVTTLRYLNSQPEGDWEVLIHTQNQKQQVYSV